MFLKTIILLKLLGLIFNTAYYKFHIVCQHFISIKQIFLQMQHCKYSYQTLNINRLM